MRTTGVDLYQGITGTEFWHRQVFDGELFFKVMDDGDFHALSCWLGGGGWSGSLLR